MFPVLKLIKLSFSSFTFLLFSYLLFILFVAFFFLSTSFSSSLTHLIFSFFSVLTINKSLSNLFCCQVDWGCRIHRLHPCRGVRQPIRVSWIYIYRYIFGKYGYILLVNIYIYIYIYIKQVLAATPHKAPTIRPTASRHENYQS